jgi:hypothetical protein
MAVDSWQDEGVHFFVFQLNPVSGAAVVPGDPPVVVFAMHPEEPEPVSAVVVSPKPGGEEAEIVDLRQPDSAYTATYPGAKASSQAPEPESENGIGANEQVSDDVSAATEQPLSAESAASQAKELTVAEADDSTTEVGEHDSAEAVEPQPGSAPERTVDTETMNGHTPEVDLALLTAVQVSQEFQSIQSRLAKRLPTDSWQEEGAHFFAFELLPADGSSPNGHEPPVAVFAMRSSEPVPISAVIVTPTADGEQAEVVDLRDPGSSYVAPIGD